MCPLVCTADKQMSWMELLRKTVILLLHFFDLPLSFSSATTFFLFLYLFVIRPLDFNPLILFELLLIQLASPLPHAARSANIQILFQHIFLLYLGRFLR